MGFLDRFRAKKWKTKDGTDVTEIVNGYIMELNEKAPDKVEEFKQFVDTKCREANGVFFKSLLGGKCQTLIQKAEVERKINTPESQTGIQYSLGEMDEEELQRAIDDFLSVEETKEKAIQSKADLDDSLAYISSVNKRIEANHRSVFDRQTEENRIGVKKLRTKMFMETRYAQIMEKTIQFLRLKEFNNYFKGEVKDIEFEDCRVMLENFYKLKENAGEQWASRLFLPYLIAMENSGIDISTDSKSKLRIPTSVSEVYTKYKEEDGKEGKLGSSLALLSIMGLVDLDGNNTKKDKSIPINVEDLYSLFPKDLQEGHDEIINGAQAIKEMSEFNELLKTDRLKTIPSVISINSNKPQQRESTEEKTLKASDIGKAGMKADRSEIPYAGVSIGLNTFLRTTTKR